MTPLLRAGHYLRRELATISVMGSTEPIVVTPSAAVWTEAALIRAALPTLEQTWGEGANMAAQQGMPGCHALIDDRLYRLADSGAYDELGLIPVADECQAQIAVIIGDVAAQKVGRQLRRGVYEFLLAVDAARHSQNQSEAAVATPSDAVEISFAPVAIDSVRAVVAQDLAERRYSECSQFLLRITRNQRGAELAEIACAAGRASRAAGERRAASDCFQASCAADPEYEESLKLGGAGQISGL